MSSTLFTTDATSPMRTMPCSFAGPVVVTCELAKFFTVGVLAALLPELAVIDVVFVAVLVVVDVVVPDAPELDPLVAVAGDAFAVRLLTAEASLDGSPVEAVALDTGPLLVAMMSGA